jgi:hypothetical protein
VMLRHRTHAPLPARTHTDMMPPGVDKTPPF